VAGPADEPRICLDEQRICIAADLDWTLDT
jgi:hypothetical protein